MAVLSWGLLAAVCAMFVGFSEAQNSSTTSIAATSLTTSSAGGSATSTARIEAATTVIVDPASSTPTPALSTPTPASSTPTPASATASPDRFYTYLKVSFKSIECTAGNDSSLLNSTLAGFFTDEVYHFVNISLVKRDICNYNFTFTFGPNIEMYNISEVLEDKLKNLIDTLKLTDVEVEVYVPGVTLGEFTVGVEECEKICCGAGGQITLTRSCSPSARCRSYKLKKEEADCVNVCPKKCSGMICKISVLVLLFGAFMNWFLM